MLLVLSVSSSTLIVMYVPKDAVVRMLRYNKRIPEKRSSIHRKKSFRHRCIHICKLGKMSNQQAVHIRIVFLLEET